MKKIFIIVFLFSCCNGNLLSQGVSNLWMMGYDSQFGWPNGGINIDFQSGQANITYMNRNMDFLETNAVICDKAGNLLFSCNGRTVANRLDNTMPNGNGLNPGPFMANYPFGLPIIQGNLVIPVPDDSMKYYLFHETSENLGSYYLPIQCLYSMVDMNLNNGFGDLVFKNSIVIQDTLIAGELTATKHANGRDWWLIIHKAFSDIFYKLLITPTGITTFVQNIGAIRNQYLGQSVFSPDGSKFAHYDVFNDVEIFDFDRCSGMLSNHVNIPINDSSIVAGIAISGNNSVLYATSLKYVYQFDLQSSNISSSKQTVAVWDGFYSPQPPYATYFCQAQIAPDNKIYINCANSTLDMHVINYPDSLGLACDVQQHSVHLPAFNAATIANHPNYFLGSIPGSPCDSLTPVAEIKNNTIPIRINPNPAQNTFYLNYKFPYGMNAVATIYNTLGETMMKKNLYWYFGYLQIDCSGLENGVYVVKVTGAGIAGSARVVIIH